MNEPQTELLAQLRDIQAAAEPGWWPPAPGWWLLAMLLLAGLVLLVRRLTSKWVVSRRRRRLVRALDALQHQADPVTQPHEYLALLNRLFRVVALRAFPGAACVRLQGDDWVRFVVSMLPAGTATDELAVLATGPYQPSPAFDQQALVRLARLWIRRYG